MAQFGWSILMDASDLEILHHNCLLNEDVSTKSPYYIQARYVTHILVDFSYNFERSKLDLNFLKDFHCCNIFKFNKQ